MLRMRPSAPRMRPFLTCGFVRVTVHVTMWGGQLLAATRNNVITCDHIDLAACWSCGTISSANLETINSNLTGLMDVRVRRLLLAAVESDATVEAGHVFPLLWQRPTPLSLVRKTSWSPTLACGRWPPLRPRFCTTAQIRGFLSTPVARYERTLQVSWWAQAAPPTDFFHGSAQHAAWTIQRGDPCVANVAPRIQFQAAWLGNEASATRRGRQRRRPHGLC